MGAYESIDVVRLNPRQISLVCGTILCGTAMQGCNTINYSILGIGILKKEE